MKTTITFLIATFFITLAAMAQSDNDLIQPCGYDPLKEQVLSNPQSKKAFDQLRLEIRTQIDKNIKKTQKAFHQPNDYVIPVVVHIVGDGEASMITDAEIIKQIDILNQGFSNDLGSSQPAADDAQIKFCLAQNTSTNDPWSDFNSTLNGVTRTAVNDAGINLLSNNHNIESNVMYGQQALANVIYFPADAYLNIWVVNKISDINTNSNTVLGYSPFPLTTGAPNQFLDGIVMRADAFGAFSSQTKFNQGRTLIHEAGHYLGLFHTFELGCYEVTNSLSCSESGDECCDTPPAAAPYQYDCLGGTNNTTNCPNSNSAMIENHMDYAWDNINTCRNTFTNDQANRMHATIQKYRPNLVSYANLLLTGVACLPPGLNPTFVTMPNGSRQFCTGNAYDFEATDYPTANYSWTFQGGMPSTSNIYNPSGITWTQPGAYTVSLTISDGTKSVSSSMTVFVSDCTPILGPNSNWHFGDRCDLSFAPTNPNNGNPAPLGNSVMRTQEASASISDEFGNLIFYTNGKRIWDKNNVLSTSTLNGDPNHSGYYGSNGPHSSTRQGVVIIPRPGTDNFYIFTMSDQPILQYNDGFGISMYEYNPVTNLLVNPAPKHPLENYATTEPIVAIPHANGTDYWIVVKTIHNFTQFGLQNPGPENEAHKKIASYLVTQNGVADVPILSDSGPFIMPTTPITNSSVGNISVSPNKKMIAFSQEIPTARLIHLYYFNSGNGYLKYITTVSGGYGIEFSPNSKVLYTNLFIQKIRQYDLSATNCCDSLPPFIDFTFNTQGTSAKPGDLQLSPDNKIYITRHVHNAHPMPEHKLAVINYPNRVVTTPSSNECGYNFDGVELNSNQYVKADLPNDIIGFIGANPTDFSFCSTDCDTVRFTNLGSGEFFEWDFGDGNTLQGYNGPIPDGTNGNQTKGNYEYPRHSYAIPGLYDVTFSIDGGNQVTHQVNVDGPPAPQIIGPTELCNNNTLPSSYIGPPGFDYLWTSSTNHPPGTNQTFNITWSSLPASLTLEITDQNNACSNSSTIHIIDTLCAIEIDVHVLLEGAVVSQNLMHHKLYDRQLLPGMTFTNHQVGIQTMAGQPYNGKPWDYTGAEGMNYSNNSYTATAVDWILVSFRTGTSATTEVEKVAAILQVDGSIHFVQQPYLPNGPSAYHIVVQHRNHLPVMSPLTSVVNGVLAFDFRTQNSWKTTTSFGQKQHPMFGSWMMYAGNGFQYDGSYDHQKDIQAGDRIEWEKLNGYFQQYLSTDHNMNGDTNGADKIIWSVNNGIASAIPMPPL